MSPTLGVVALWVAFAGSHMVLASRTLRPRLVGVLGEGGYTVVFSVVAFVFLVPLVMYYLEHRHQGASLWLLRPTGWVLWLVYLVNLLAFVLVAAGLLRPSPTQIGARAASEPRGAQRWTRHPLMMGVALWALAHLVVNGFATDVAFFGGFAIFALAGTWHQDARKLAADDGSYRAFCERAPFVPFARGGLVAGARELGLAAPAAGLLLAAVLRYLHFVSWL